MRLRRIVPVLTFVIAFTFLAKADEKLPDLWRKTMTNDPSTNYWLQKFSEPLPDRMTSVVRNIMLFRLLSFSCKGIKANRSAFDDFVRTSGLMALPAEDAKDASIRGSALFDGFDYESLAHLCAGTDYLFGPHGVLVKNLMSKGSGDLAIPYHSDPKNPYLPVRPLLPN